MKSPRRRALMGIARVFLGCAKAALVGRGHEHPHGKKKDLRNGHDARETVFARDQFPRHCRMFMAALPGGFGIFGVWVGRLLDQRGRIGTASTCEADRRTRVAPRAICRSARARCRPMMQLIVV